MATITTDGAQCVASLPEEAARHKLRECLGWEPFDDEKEMRKSIYLEFLLQNLKYAVEKGFTWEQTVAVVQFADRFISNMKSSTEITDTLSFYKSKAVELVDSLGERNFKIYSEFIFGTILPHYKLYKLVFTTKRKEETPCVKAEVEPPFVCEALKSAKEEQVWNYEKQVDELKQKEEERLKDRLEEKKAKVSKLESQSKESIEGVEMIEAPMSKESIANIVQDVIKRYSQMTAETLKSKIEETKDDLEYKLEVTSLPRPKALGPPPRYTTAQKPNTPVKQAKSPKPGSRASQGSGKGKKK